MDHFPMVFSPAEIGLVRAGEMGGFVVEALKELQTQIETDLETRRRCNFPIVYFWIVFITAVWITIPFTSIVKPAISANNAAAGIPAIFLTMLHFSLPLTLAVLGGVWLFRRLPRHPRWRRRWHTCLLRLPGFGAIAVGRSRAVFAAALRMLYHGGVNPYDAWSAASDSVPNLILSEQLGAQREGVRVGGKFSDAMRNSGVYPLSDVGQLATGERTGNIEEVLGRIADSYNQEAGAALARMPLVVKVALLVIGTVIAVAAMGAGVYKYFMGVFQGVDAFMGTG
jgi:type II secretory pathway component PulF